MSESLIERYARLLVEVALDLREGQPLAIEAQVEHAELVRAVARAGYKAGAPWVDVFYGDQVLRKALVESPLPDTDLGRTPQWLIERSNALADAQGANVAIVGQPDPTLFNADLAPVPIGKRTWKTYNYASLWVGMSVCIPTYMLASGLIAGSMNWWQRVASVGI